MLTEAAFEDCNDDAVGASVDAYLPAALGPLPAAAALLTKALGLLPAEAALGPSLVPAVFFEDCDDNAGGAAAA